MIIGLDDNGNFVDIKDSKKLPEDLPNKCRNILCIIPSVNSEKTLYRDLQKFVNIGLLKEIGEKKVRKHDLP